jgi:hypothetical protein
MEGSTRCLDTLGMTLAFVVCRAFRRSSLVARRSLLDPIVLPPSPYPLRLSRYQSNVPT